jgi:hypothetical protein
VPLSPCSRPLPRAPPYRRLSRPVPRPSGSPASLSPTTTAPSAFHVAQATELAGRGFVVIGVDHVGDAEVVDVGGGELVSANPVGEDWRERSFGASPTSVTSSRTSTPCEAPSA